MQVTVRAAYTKLTVWNCRIINITDRDSHSTFVYNGIVSRTVPQYYTSLINFFTRKCDGMLSLSRDARARAMTLATPIGGNVQNANVREPRENEVRYWVVLLWSEYSVLGRKMVNSCCVLGCANHVGNEKGLRFYRFPLGQQERCAN